MGWLQYQMYILMKVQLVHLQECFTFIKVVKLDNSFKIGDGLSIVFNKVVIKGIAKIDSTTVGESSVLIHKDDLIIL